MTIIDQFDLKAAKFNFSRDYFESVELLNKAPITDFPDHFITNVAGTLYQLTKANGVWDDTENTWKVSPWKKLEFGDKNALTASGDDNTISQNGSNLSRLQLNDGANKVTIDTTNGININSFNNGDPGGITLTATGLKFDNKSGTNTTVWTTDGGTTDISGIASNEAVAAIQAKLVGIDDTVKGYVDSQVGGLAQALVFKGGIPEGGLPENPKVGDTYVVGTIGEYAGETCEVGDTIICTVAKTSETAAQWLVVQKNIDGAVTRGDEKSWDGKLLIGAAGNQVSSITGTKGQIIQADANGDPTYVTPSYASTDDVNALDGRITTNTTAVSQLTEKVGLVEKKADDASGAAAAANKAAVAAQTAADEAKAGLENKADKAPATADAAGLMSAADKSKLDGLSNYVLPEIGQVHTKDLYKIAIDVNGRVTEIEAVTSADIYNLGIPEMTAIKPNTIEDYFAESTVTA